MSESRSSQESDYDEDELMEKIPARFREVVKPPKKVPFSPDDYWWD